MRELGIGCPVWKGGGAAEHEAGVNLRVRVLVLDGGAEEGEEFAFGQTLVAVGGADCCLPV